MRILIIIIIMIGLVVYQVDMASPGTSQLAMNMSVRLEVHDGEEYRLRISLINTGEVPFTFYEYELPWKYRYSLQLLAIPAFRSADSVLRERLPVEDPTFSKKIQLMPGQKVEGAVSLTDRFPSLREEIKKHAVILFWTYEMELVSGANLERQGGWLVIPEKERER